MDVDDGFPDLRSIPDLLDLMEEVAARCEAAIDASRAPELFEEALRLGVEIRVPRMPDTDDELKRMLDAAREGPTFTTEEVLAHLAEARSRSDLLRRRFHKHLTYGRAAEAARMLAPGDDSMLSWERDATLATTYDGMHLATVTSAHGSATCRSRNEGLAMLGVVMRLHAQRELWIR